MSAEQISLQDFAAAFSWQTFSNLPDDRAAAETVCDWLRMMQRGSEPVIIALGEKVFGALLVITGAAIILAGHRATTDDMIADLIAGG
jgi:hypothetical protein